MKKVLNIAKAVLADLVKLKNPAVASGIVAVILQALPGVNLSAADLGGIFIVIGGGAAILDKIISDAEATTGEVKKEISNVEAPTPTSK